VTINDPHGAPRLEETGERPLITRCDNRKTGQPPCWPAQFKITIGDESRNACPDCLGTMVTDLARAQGGADWVIAVTPL
jgi:hypothetical protein